MGVAVVITLDSQDGVCREAKIALGAVAPTPIRAYDAESILRGKAIEKELIEKSAEVAAGEARPITDIRGSSQYRREMVKVLTRRAIIQALELSKAG